MNKVQIDLLNLCMEDDLFCALYEALCVFEKEWHTAQPVELWVEALQARKMLYGTRRPDLLLPQLFANMPSNDALITEALLMWMLFTEDWNTNATPLKDALSHLIVGFGEAWQRVYTEFRKSEQHNEELGYNIKQCVFYSKDIPFSAIEDSHAKGSSLVHELVSEALNTHSPELCRALYYILSHIDYQKDHVFESEVKRLAGLTDGIEKEEHEPRKIERHNHFAKDSVRFEAGSTMNGDVTIDEL